MYRFSAGDRKIVIRLKKKRTKMKKKEKTTYRSAIMA